MSKNKKSTGKKNTGNKKVQKKSNLPLIIGAAVVLCAAIAVTVIPQLKKQEDSGAGTVQVIEEGGSLVIPVSEVSTTVSFYPVEVDGTSMEILAVKDSEGKVRTAFNTCQVCYSSGRGYYVQDGDTLVCQNCGNRFTVDDVEVESGGCNPWPIFEEDKTVGDDSIEISYDFLSASKAAFENWKVQF